MNSCLLFIKYLNEGSKLSIFSTKKLTNLYGMFFSNTKDLSFNPFQIAISGTQNNYLAKNLLFFAKNR
jgi:hypothetical protein